MVSTVPTLALDGVYNADVSVRWCLQMSEAAAGKWFVSIYSVYEMSSVQHVASAVVTDVGEIPLVAALRSLAERK